MKKIIAKYGFLWYFGGATYCVIETAGRGYSHWTMIVLGGVCFVALGLLNEVIPWEMPLPLQMLIGAAIITGLELVTGCIVNLRLGWGVWDYSGLPFNFLGQICLPFSLIWFFLAAVGIILDDLLRWKFFGGEKPRYTLI
jgi:uncharacterized membrane protein